MTDPRQHLYAVVISLCIRRGKIAFYRWREQNKEELLGMTHEQIARAGLAFSGDFRLPFIIHRSSFLYATGDGSSTG